MRDLESVVELSQMILGQSKACAGVWRVVDVKGEINERDVVERHTCQDFSWGPRLPSSATWSGIHLTCTAISVTTVHRSIWCELARAIEHVSVSYSYSWLRLQQATTSSWSKPGHLWVHQEKHMMALLMGNRTKKWTATPCLHTTVGQLRGGCSCLHSFSKPCYGVRRMAVSNDAL